MIMESKLKINYFNELRSKESAHKDVSLLQECNPRHPDLPRYLRNPERYSDEILWALLNECDVDDIVSNREYNTENDETIHDGSDIIIDDTKTDLSDPTITAQPGGDVPTPETTETTIINPDEIVQDVPIKEPSETEKVESAPDPNDSKISDPDDPSKKK